MLEDIQHELQLTSHYTNYLIKAIDRKFCRWPLKYSKCQQFNATVNDLLQIILVFIFANRSLKLNCQKRHLKLVP